MHVVCYNYDMCTYVWAWCVFVVECMYVFVKEGKCTWCYTVVLTEKLISCAVEHILCMPCSCACASMRMGTNHHLTSACCVVDRHAHDANSKYRVLSAL